MNVLRIVSLIVAIGLLSATAYGQGSAPDTEEDSAPKIVGAGFEPARPETGDRLKMRVQIGGAALRAEVLWFVNGEEAGLSDCDENSEYAELDHLLKAGDRIKATATPFDQENEPGRRVTKELVVRNGVPVVKLKEQKIDRTVYKAKLEAVDPEGGPISFSIQEGPPGMKIDPKGLITWEFAKDTSGRFDVKVSARDEQGAQAIVLYSFRIWRSVR